MKVAGFLLGLALIGVGLFACHGEGNAYADPDAAITLAVTAAPCEPAEQIGLKLAMVAPRVDLYQGAEVQPLIDAAWQVRVAGRAPRADGIIVAYFRDGSVGIHPVREGISCASLLLSPRMFERLIARIRGDPA